MEVSIIIPCKNEEKYIGKLLESIKNQKIDFDFEVIICDADSTDNTVSIIKSFQNDLPIKIISGGLPSVGRNNGALEAKYDVLLFMDADCYLKHDKIIKYAVNKLNSGYDLIGAFLNIEDNKRVKALYFVSNLIMILSKFGKPFVVGGFFMIKKEIFLSLGGFDEELKHCEDYFLSKQITSDKFSIIAQFVYTDDRRFIKMGYFGFTKYFIKNIVNRNDKEFFKKEIKYWDEI